MRHVGIVWLSLGLLFSSAAFAADKVALVIGNGAYQHVPHLDNPVNDAQDVAKALTDAGFEVVERENATRNQMADAVRDFAQRIKGAEVALIYYAGHGMQMEGENYLLPIDANVETPADARFATINLADIQEEMSGPGRANIIVLDACRNNPFAKKLAGSGRAIGDRGLGRIDASGVGSLIVFATQPNNVALDGAGRNSPFAAALVKNIPTPHIEVRQMISRVRADVLAATNQKQVPWDNSSLVGDVYLAGKGLAEVTPLEPAPLPVAKAPEAKPPETKPAQANPPRQQAAALEGDAADCTKLASPEPPFSSPEDIKALRKQRDWNRAVSVCKAASEADAGSMELKFLLGESYYRAKDYLKATRELNVAAEAGNSDAQARLGYLYINGFGVVRDYYRAIEYLKKAAAAGNPRAITNLGAMYSNAWGVPEDDAKALALYEKGIELGNPFALSQTGIMYFNGKGAPRDYATAEQYFVQAANLGDGYAMKFLAAMYEHGLVGPADAARAGQLRLRAEEEDPESPNPQITFAPPAKRLAQHLNPTHRIVYYHWNGGQSYNPSWQAAPGDNRCCPKNQLICPLGRHWC